MADLTPDEARDALTERLRRAHFPEGAPQTLGGILSWIDETLGVDLADAESGIEVAQATDLLAATTEALLSGTGRQDFIDALGTDDWQNQPITDVIAAQRLALGDGLLDATIEELQEAGRRVDAERLRSGLLSQQDLDARNEVQTEHAAELMVEDLRAGRPAGQGKGGIDPIPVPGGMSLTTQTLRAFQERATERNLSRLLSAERSALLAPNAYHEIENAWQHTSQEGYKNVRLGLKLHFGSPFLREGERTEHATVDILSQDWDMLMVPYKNQQREYGLNKHVPGLYLTTPRWEAVRSYPSVHELHSFYQGHLSAYENTGYLPRRIELPRLNFVNLMKGQKADETMTLQGDAIKEWLARPRTILGAETLVDLHNAHPVVFDPEWVDAQEDWSWSEAWAYAARVVLPYDPLYLDFEGPGGLLPYIDVPGGSARVPLCGCLFATDADTGRLTITPMGPRVLLDNVYWPDIPMGGTPYELAGRVVIGEGWQPDENDAVLDVVDHTSAFTITYQGPRDLEDTMVVINLPSAADMAEYGLEEQLPPGIDAYACPGYIELPLNNEEALTIAERDGEHDDAPAASRWAATTLPAVVKSLSMLSLLDNENVELRPYPVTRQVRRNAQRKGIPIASEIVVVRKHRYVDGKRVTEGEGHRVNYSHQFPVRRHEQHHGPHTPAYRAHPEKAKPCGRCGSCRRFVVESYIKGDPDKPLVARKTYVFRDKAS